MQLDIVLSNMLPNMAFERDAPKAARPSTLRYASHKGTIVRLLLTLVTLLTSSLTIAADLPGIFKGGIVYGSKAAFQISAPEGWVLDNQSGVADGVFCVLYPAGGTWAKSPTVMYAKIASPEYPEKNAFMEFTSNYFKKDDANFSQLVVREGKTHEGYAYTVKKYDRPSYPVYELTAYIQLPDAVAFIVYSAPSTDARDKDTEKFNGVLKSLKYMPEHIRK